MFDLRSAPAEAWARSLALFEDLFDGSHSRCVAYLNGQRELTPYEAMRLDASEARIRERLSLRLQMTWGDVQSPTARPEDGEVADLDEPNPPVGCAALLPSPRVTLAPALTASRYPHRQRPVGLIVDIDKQQRRRAVARGGRPHRRPTERKRSLKHHHQAISRALAEHSSASAQVDSSSGPEESSSVSLARTRGQRRASCIPAAAADTRRASVVDDPVEETQCESSVCATQSTTTSPEDPLPSRSRLPTPRSAS
eukprot:5578749-Prymnesium_polylepis.5